MANNEKERREKKKESEETMKKRISVHTTPHANNQPKCHATRFAVAAMMDK